MSAHKLANLMRQQAGIARSATTEPKTGVITDYQPFAVKVMLQPEAIETGWLPLLSPWVGNGWGMFCAPSVGDSVEIQFEQGHPEAPFACLRFFNDQDQPLQVPAKEFWLVHSTGSFVKLTNDGKLLLNGQAEIDATAPTLNVTITGNANLTVGGTASYTAALHKFSGPVTMDNTLAVAKAAALNGGFTAQAGTGGGAAGTITGDLTATGTVTGQADVVAAGKSGAHHTHNDPQGGTVGQPI